MEILQTIWTALITENQLIINIITVPMIVIETTITMLLFTQILNVVSSRRQKITYVALFSIIATFSEFCMPSPYNNFINIIAQFALVSIIFKTNLLKTILCIILPLVIFVIAGSIVQIVFSWIFRFSIAEVLLIPIYKFCLSLIIYVCVYVIYRLFRHFNIKISLFDKININTYSILIINFIIGILAIAVQVYVVTMYALTVPTVILLTNLLALFIYFAVSIYSLLRTNNLERTKQDLEIEKEYNKTITGLYDSIRGFRHDFNNIVQAIGGYVSTENIDGLKSYYKDLLVDCQRVNNLTVLSPEIINNPAIYSLLTSKYHTADELGITINLEMFLDLETTNMKIYELTRVLGILLDNAIEASNKCENKIINIVFRKDSKVNRQLLSIENTYLDKDIDTDKIFEKGYTSKEYKDDKSHGLGLWEVRQVLKRNNNLNLYTTKDDEFFTQQLEIYN